MPRHPETVIFAGMKLLSWTTFMVWEVVDSMPGSLVVSVAAIAEVDVPFTDVEDVTVTPPASTFEVLVDVIML